jgi:hypothetical protein
MTEQYTRWEPVAGVEVPCFDVVLHADPVDLTVLLRFSAVTSVLEHDLLIHFGRDVVACMSHDEFVHPWQAYGDVAPVPRLAGKWAPYAYPLLLVSDSRWLASFSDSQILDNERAAARHFRFVSFDNTVDVLTVGDAVAEWVAPTARPERPLS